MNIYEFKVSGETEWICANTIFEALQFYNTLNDMSIHDFSGLDDIKIVPEVKWAEMNIDCIDTVDDQGNQIKIQTFAEYMASAVKPDIIATTCW